MLTDRKDMFHFKNLFQDGNKKKTILTVIIVCLLIIIASGYLYIHSALKAVNPHHQTEKRIEIPTGSNVLKIGTILKEHHLIKNPYVFAFYARLHHDENFQAGTFELSTAMTLDEIVQRLQKGGIAAIEFTIPEGTQIDEIAAIVSKHSSYSQQQFLKQVDDPKFIQLMIHKYPNMLTAAILSKQIRHPLEGYLFPATYSFYNKNISLQDMISKMIAKTNDVLSPYQEEREKKQLSVHQLMTMASLVEEEATGDVDREKIASVFYNRLAKNMPLQTDPTVLYAMKQHKEKVVYKDLKVNSPYNTYKHKGLPPGPIGSPGEKSIQAALKPAKTDYLYFLANIHTGKVYFAKTLKEHNALKEKYISKKD